MINGHFSELFQKSLTLDRGGRRGDDQWTHKQKILGNNEVTTAEADAAMINGHCHRLTAAGSRPIDRGGRRGDDQWTPDGRLDLFLVAHTAEADAAMINGHNSCFRCW